MFFEPLIIGNVLVSSGRVMRPEEVEESLADRPAVRNVVGGWYLCGDVLEKCSTLSSASKVTARCK